MPQASEEQATTHVQEPYRHLRESIDDNHRTLIAAKAANDPNTYVVLCLLKDERPTYVTWRVGPVDLGATYWGHYHTDIALAVRDYEART